MINFFLGFGSGSILSVFCLCLLQAASKLDEMEEKFREEPEMEEFAELTQQVSKQIRGYGDRIGLIEEMADAYIFA